MVGNGGEIMHTYKFTGATPPEGSDVWYRANDKRYANYDPFAEFDQPTGSHLRIEITRYTVERYMPKSVLLRDMFGNNVRVLGNAVRQHAVPTIELALLDLKARKETHVRMSQLRADRAREHLDATVKCLDDL